MSDDTTTTERRWVAIGEAGAVGSILQTGAGFEVRLVKDDAPHGTFPTLDAAKAAIHASMLPGSERPEFREH